MDCVSNCLGMMWKVENLESGKRREFSAGRRPAPRAKQARRGCEPCGVTHCYDLPTLQRVSAGLRPAPRAKQARRGCEPCGVAHGYDLPTLQRVSAGLRPAPPGTASPIAIYQPPQSKGASRVTHRKRFSTTVLIV